MYLILVTETKVLILQRKDLWMIIDVIYELALLITCHVCFRFPYLIWNAVAIDLYLEIKIHSICIWSRTKRWFLTGDGRSNIGWCCLYMLQFDPWWYWVLQVRKDILMLSPFLSMLALGSVSSIWSVMNYSVANKGYWIHTFCLVVLIRMIGTLLVFVVATHLFMTMPRGRLWCWACSTRQVILGGILLVCPQHSNSQITRDTNKVFFRANSDLSYGSIFSFKVPSVFYFRQVICLWGLIMFCLLGHNFRCYSQCLFLSYMPE